jgi:hypothetical protein
MPVEHRPAATGPVGSPMHHKPRSAAPGTS